MPCTSPAASTPTGANPRRHAKRQRTELFGHYAATSPVGRIGLAHDVAKAIVSLIPNDFITGTVLTVDDGFRLTAAA
jgi:NAD(P)-dependent dehydrogenase (short-subunit alcohol dehydrogenase family)